MSDIGRGDRAKKMAVLARLACKAQCKGFQLCSQSFGKRLLRSGAADSSGLHLFNDGLVRSGSLQCELARQQEIATIALGYFHHVSAVTEICYVFLQNDFHFELLQCCGRSLNLAVPVSLDTGIQLRVAPRRIIEPYHNSLTSPRRLQCYDFFKNLQHVRIGASSELLRTSLSDALQTATKQCCGLA